MRLYALIVSIALAGGVAVYAQPKMSASKLSFSTSTWLEQNLVLKKEAKDKDGQKVWVPTNKDEDDSDWSEIIARWAWVKLGFALPSDALGRNIARQNSDRSSRTLTLDTAPEKKALSIIISKMNDEILNHETTVDLKQEIEELKRARAKDADRLNALQQDVDDLKAKFGNKKQ